MTEVTDNNSVKVKITDNGYGMTEEVRQKIFDHFFTTKLIGYGIG
nr:ATP-binding protein [Okeania sp. SIO2C9]